MDQNSESSAGVHAPGGPHASPSAPPRGGPHAGLHSGVHAAPRSGVFSRTVFGGQLTEHCLLQRFREGRWSEPVIEPSRRFELAQQTRALHYGQSIFEGFKAHRLPDGSVALFRPQPHLARLNRSSARMCLPSVDLEKTLSWVRALVARDRDAVPAAPDSLYVRPILFAADEDLIAGAGEDVTLAVMLSPVAPLCDGVQGLRLRTETRHVRAFPGGTGAVKAAGNYAAAMLAQRTATEEGYDDVVWLDAVQRAYVEESGAMNLFVVRKGAVLTAPAGDTVLPGVTRDTILRLAEDRGIPAREEPIPVDPDYWSEVTEVFTSGTGVGCVPIASIDHEGESLFERPEPGRLQPLLSKALMDAKEGRAPDVHGWRVLC